MTVLTAILGIALTLDLAVLAAAVAVDPDDGEENTRRAGIAVTSVFAVALAVAFVLAYRAVTA